MNAQNASPNASHSAPGDDAGPIEHPGDNLDSPEAPAHNNHQADDSLEPTLHQHRRVTVEDEEDEEDNDGFQPLGVNAIDDDDWIGDELGSDDEDEPGREEDSQFQYYAPIDEMVESFEREMAEIGAWSAVWLCGPLLTLRYNRRRTY